MITAQQIANALDLAVLQPTATSDDVRCACALANKHGIKSVCVAPVYTRLASSLFDNVSTVIGFPHGNATPDVKYFEAIGAVRDGACELDVVVNYGRFLDGDPVTLIIELALIVSLGVPVKAILETCYYTRSQIVAASKHCVDCGVQFVKTSTGFGRGGANTRVVQVILDAVNGRCGVKASGGIKSYDDACTYLDMGCTRLGAGNYHLLLP